MTNILSNSFEDLKKYQDQIIKRINFSINENLKFKNSSIKAQILNNNLVLENDWELMDSLISRFVSYPTHDFSQPQYQLGISTLFVNYNIKLKNVTKDLLGGIQSKILIKSGLNGDGPIRPINNFNTINENNTIQFLNDDETEILIVKSLILAVSLGPNKPPYYEFDEGYGPLPPYYSKLIFQINNFQNNI